MPVTYNSPFLFFFLYYSNLYLDLDLIRNIQIVVILLYYVHFSFFSLFIYSTAYKWIILVLINNLKTIQDPFLIKALARSIDLAIYLAFIISSRLYN